MENETVAKDVASSETSPAEGASQETWQARATLWELLAFTFRYPTAELAEAVVTGEWADAARETTVALGIELPVGWGKDAAADSPNPDALLHALRAEATRLFVGAPDPVVSPYEGVWAAADDGVQPLLFVNPRSMAVERFCKSCGLGRPVGTNEPLDHASTECELLEYLAALVAGIVALPADAPALVDFPGGSPAAAYAQFLADHATTWLPRFADVVTGAARVPFYRAAAQLLKVTCVWLCLSSPR